MAPSELKRKRFYLHRIGAFSEASLGFLLCAAALISCSAQVSERPRLPPVFSQAQVENSEADPRTRQYLPPTRIVWKSTDDPDIIMNAEHLLRSGNGQADLVNRNITVLKNEDAHRAGILLDFGAEIHGGLSIVTGQWESKKPVRLRVRFGESVSEAMSEIDGDGGATNDHAIRDYEITAPWLGEIELGETGFRFARIDLLDEGDELQLKEVRAVFTYRDIPYLGSFKSSDPLLNQIWLTGAYTVHLNMQKFLWDGVKRDRLVWVGDMHPEVMTINTVFGGNEVTNRSLDLIREITPLPEYMNGISSYSMWWLIIQRDLYRYRGDKDYLTKHKSYIIGLLKLLMSQTEGGEEKLEGWRFLDWSTFDNDEALHAGLQALLVMTMDAGAELAAILEDDELAAQCRLKADELRRRVPPADGNKQATALQAMAGMIPPADANKVISRNGVDGFSTFYGYYMLEAKAKAGDYQGALDNIRTYWGGMLALGATTFWEDFDVDWLENAARIDELTPPGKVDVHATYGDHSFTKLRMSFAHGWASGPTAWLTEHVLGVVPIEPGGKTLRIDPHLGDLTAVEGEFPTPYGVVKIRHAKSENGDVKTEVDAPKGVEIILGSK